MSKKSYKRNQNRLYREIKRRMIAEDILKKPVKYTVCKLPVEKLEIKQEIQHYFEKDEGFKEHIKHDMANKIAEELIKKKLISFYDYTYDYPLSEDEVILDLTEIRAILNVVRPVNDN